MRDSIEIKKSLSWAIKRRNLATWHIGQGHTNKNWKQLYEDACYDVIRYRRELNQA